jgi:hypothetical protein
MPRRSSGFTVTKRDELCEDEGVETAGLARARRNPACLRGRFAGGPSLDGSGRLDMGYHGRGIGHRQQ